VSCPTAPASRLWNPGRPLDLARTLAPMRRGAGDPAYRVDADNAVWRVVRTPAGPGTLRLAAHRGVGVVEAWAWGAGADWLLESVPALLGSYDEASDFVPRHPVLRDVAARHPGWRIGRGGLVLEALVPAILEQKVTGRQARASWRALVRLFGEPAPGPAPAGMAVPPTAADWARIPSWEWHRAGVEPARSRAIVTAARAAGRLEETIALGTVAADGRLRALPGVGVWTSAETRQRSHGDPDAVSVGDYHLPAVVGVALTGHRVDDAGMLELLAPYAGHRYRVTRLIEMSGVHHPRYGPRMTIQDHRQH
jgi:3-methyladenine DNA glycosylase/8-oxoguanine DNA glycosylase